MTKPDHPTVAGESVLIEFLRAIAAGDDVAVAHMLVETPTLAIVVVRGGATRQNPTPYFLENILHYIYAGDTALHVAGAAYRRATAESLVARGADVGARNRRGAQPLHYAATGTPRPPMATSGRSARSSST